MEPTSKPVWSAGTLGLLCFAVTGFSQINVKIDIDPNVDSRATISANGSSKVTNGGHIIVHPPKDTLRPPVSDKSILKKEDEKGQPLNIKEHEKLQPVNIIYRDDIDSKPTHLGLVASGNFITPGDGDERIYTWVDVPEGHFIFEWEDPHYKDPLHKKTQSYSGPMRVSIYTSMLHGLSKESQVFSSLQFAPEFPGPGPQVGASLSLSGEFTGDFMTKSEHGLNPKLLSFLKEGVYVLDVKTPYTSTTQVEQVILSVTRTAPDANEPGGTEGGGGGTTTITNIGAIMSTEGGLVVNGANNNIISNAANSALGDVGSHMFNARSGGGGGNGDNGGTVAAIEQDSSTRYLSFASNQKIDYRVALGLSEGKEVEIVDSLAGGEHRMLMGSPIAMMGVPVSYSAAPVILKAVVAAPDDDTSGKASIADKVPVEEAPEPKYEVYTEFNYGYYDQDNLTASSRGFTTDNYAGTLGFQFDVTEWLVLGTAFTHLWSDTEVAAGLGDIDLEGQLVSVYGTAFFGDSYIDTLYSYGDFNSNIKRNTLLGRTAVGDTDSYSHNVSVNAGHVFRMKSNQNVTFGPNIGFDYTSGNVDGYAERNGGQANLIYGDSDFESAVSNLGGHITHRGHSKFGPVTTQVRAGWNHEFSPEGDTVSASLATSPFTVVNGGTARNVGGYTATSETPHVGQDWLELGAGVRLDFAGRWNLQLNYEGMFGRNNASAHFGGARLGYEW